jgi:hypothetical protein
MTPKPFVGTQVDLAVAWESVPALQIDVGSWQRDREMAALVVGKGAGAGLGFPFSLSIPTRSCGRAGTF